MNTKTLHCCKLIKRTPLSLLNYSTAVQVTRSPSDLNTCVSYLQACALHRNLPKGKQLHSWMLVNGLLSSPLSITSLINMYSKCNQPSDALAVFDGARDRNLFAWNATIAGFITNNLPKDAFELYEKMRLHHNVIPDKFTFPCVIKACSDLAEISKVRRIHGELVKLGLDSDVFVASALINFYLKFSFMVEAHQMFVDLPERDVVLWNSMINGYAQIREFDMALEVFRRMVCEAGLVPSKFTVTGICSIFATTVDVNNGKALHGFVKKIGYESDVVVSNSLIDMYGKCKSVEDAQEIFEEMSERDIFSWNSIISVHEQSADYDGTLKHFDRMREAGVLPDVVTITSVLPACSQLAALMHGREIHCYMIVNGLRRDGFCGDFDDIYVENAIMDMYAKCGSLGDAQSVFDMMKFRDAASWNIMIMGYGLHGQSDTALNFFTRMIMENMKPDEVTFVGVLSACSHGGLLKRGQEILAIMESEYEVVPTVEHYACTVDMLGRAGFLNEAYELALTMPIEPNPVVWRAFLAACRLHGNASMAEIAAKRIFELEPEHCGSYVLISNIYGATGRHQEVSEVRQAMKVKNVQKTPGCSWIELKNRLHVFTTGDRSHPESNHIYTELDLLIGGLRDYGYVPDLNHV